jgi:hypothetical protein
MVGSLEVPKVLEVLEVRVLEVLKVRVLEVLEVRGGASAAPMVQVPEVRVLGRVF